MSMHAGVKSVDFDSCDFMMVCCSFCGGATKIFSLYKKNAKQLKIHINLPLFCKKIHNNITLKLDIPSWLPGAIAPSGRERRPCSLRCSSATCILYCSACEQRQGRCHVLGGLTLGRTFTCLFWGSLWVFAHACTCA